MTAKTLDLSIVFRTIVLALAVLAVCSAPKPALAVVELNITQGTIQPLPIAITLFLCWRWTPECVLRSILDCDQAIIHRQNFDFREVPLSELTAVSQIWNGGERMVEASPWLQAASLSNCSASEGCGFRA